MRYVISEAALERENSEKYPQKVKFWQDCLFSKSVSVDAGPSGLDVWQEMVIVTVKVKNISRRCWWREVGLNP